MTNQTETRTTYNKLVGRIGDEYYYLEDLFEHSKDLRGATGFSLRPVTFDEMTERRDNFDDDGELWRMAVKAGETELSRRDWDEQVLDVDGDEAVIDLSWFHPYGEDLLREIDPDHEEYEYTEARGCGRHFDKDMKWDELYEPELWELIKKYES